MAIALFCGAVWGCASEVETEATPAPSPEPAAHVDGRERVVSVRLRVRVTSVATAADRARVAVEDAGGFVESSHLDADRGAVEVRVPIDRLEAARATLASLGHVETESESSEDVTLAHADQQARLTSARAEEARLVAMFADRTASLADVLAVEHELTRVRDEIERVDAEERALRDRVAMARISLELHLAHGSAMDDPVALVRDAAGAGMRATGAILLATTATLAALAPSGLVVLALVVAARLVRRYRQRRLSASRSIVAPNVSS